MKRLVTIRKIKEAQKRLSPRKFRKLMRLAEKLSKKFS